MYGKTTADSIEDLWNNPALACPLVLQCVAVCCSVLQYVAVCCSVLLYVAMCQQPTRSSYLPIYDKHTSAHILQYAAIQYCKIMQRTLDCSIEFDDKEQHTTTHRNTLQQTLWRCNLPWHDSTDTSLDFDDEEQHTATRCKTLQYITTRTLQLILK